MKDWGSRATMRIILLRPPCWSRSCLPLMQNLTADFDAEDIVPGTLSGKITNFVGYERFGSIGNWVLNLGGAVRR